MQASVSETLTWFWSCMVISDDGLISFCHVIKKCVKGLFVSLDTRRITRVCGCLLTYLRRSWRIPIIAVDVAGFWVALATYTIVLRTSNRTDPKASIACVRDRMLPLSVEEQHEIETQDTSFHSGWHSQHANHGDIKLLYAHHMLAPPRAVAKQDRGDHEHKKWRLQALSSPASSTPEQHKQDEETQLTSLIKRIPTLSLPPGNTASQHQQHNDFQSQTHGNLSKAKHYGNVIHPPVFSTDIQHHMATLPLNVLLGMSKEAMVLLVNHVILMISSYSNNTLYQHHPQNRHRQQASVVHPTTYRRMDSVYNSVMNSRNSSIPYPHSGLSISWREQTTYKKIAHMPYVRYTILSNYKTRHTSYTRHKQKGTQPK